MSQESTDCWNENLRACGTRIVRCQAAAWDELFELTAVRGMRYAAAITRHTTDAEDAYQAALVRLANHPRAFAEAEVPWAWLLTVIRREALRLCRRSGLPVGLAVREECSHEPPPEQQFCQRELREAVHEALRHLPCEQAEVVVLKLWENLTFDEIAALTETSLNTVASRYRYALAKLMPRLKPWVEETDHASPRVD